MGNWTLVIHGTGPHHNRKPVDADAISDAVVKLLRDAGQTIEGASFTSGGRLEYATTESDDREPFTVEDIVAFQERVNRKHYKRD